MKTTGELQCILEDLASWFHEYCMGYNDAKIIMRHTRDNLVHCSFFADDIDGFGDILFQEHDILSEFDIHEKRY